MTDVNYFLPEIIVADQVDSLLLNDIIYRKVYDELIQINKYRNLIFHAHIESADEPMIKKIKSAYRKLLTIIKEKDAK